MQSKTIQNCPSRANRLVPCLIASLASVVLLTGCASDAPGRKPLLPFGKNAHDEAIRQQAKSDNFPTAKQAGL